MTNTQLFNDIYAKVKAFAISQGVPLGFEFNSFTPPESGAWLELSIANNDRDFDLNKSPLFRRGILQINVGIKKDDGDTLQRSLIDEIELNFPIGTLLSGTIKTTSNPKAEPPFIRDSTDYISQVSFEYNE